MSETKLVSTGNDCLVKTFDLKTGTKLFTLDMHKCPVLSAIFHPLNDTIYSAGVDDWIGIWSNEGQYVYSLILVLGWFY